MTTSVERERVSGVRRRRIIKVQARHVVAAAAAARVGDYTPTSPSSSVKH